MQDNVIESVGDDYTVVDDEEYQESTVETSTSKQKKKKRAEINLNNILDNSSSDDDKEEETFIRLGKIKISGLWEVMLTVSAVIFAVVGAWINFDMTLSKHTEEIKALQVELTEYKRNNNENVSLLQSNIETRISSLERIVIQLQNDLDKYDYRYNQEMRMIQNDLTLLKQSSNKHNTEITQLLRDLNRIESRISNLAK